MKRVILICLLGIVGLAVTLPAAAADSGWSVGVDVGQSSFRKSDLPMQTGPGWSTRYSTQPSAYRLTVAYQINPYWAIEGGYVDLGRAKAHSSCSACTIPDLGTYLDSQADVKGWQVAGVVNYPFSDSWKLFVRLGLIDAKVDSTVSDNAFALNTTVNASATSVRPAYGVGVAWTVSDNVAVRLGWDGYESLGKSASTGKYSVGVVSLGAQVSF